MDITITLTETQEKVFKYFALSPQEWVQNAVDNRLRKASDEIVKIAIDKFLEAGQTIPGSKDEIINAAFDNGWVNFTIDTNLENN